MQTSNEPPSKATETFPVAGDSGDYKEGDLKDEEALFEEHKQKLENLIGGKTPEEAERILQEEEAVVDRLIKEKEASVPVEHDQLPTTFPDGQQAPFNPHYKQHHPNATAPPFSDCSPPSAYLSTEPSNPNAPNRIYPDLPPPPYAPHATMAPDTSKQDLYLRPNEKSLLSWKLTCQAYRLRVAYCVREHRPDKKYEEGAKKIKKAKERKESLLIEQEKTPMEPAFNYNKKYKIQGKIARQDFKIRFWEKEIQNR